uniref:Uncharacterized protein n=1 Tax=Arundo donax TaxID=35708 RepID=A0A0A8Z6Z3_ARUDO
MTRRAAMQRRTTSGLQPI